MTDDEIIRALECCGSGILKYPCSICPLNMVDDCEYILPKRALDLINSQKAEIERLKQEYKEYCEANRIIAYQRNDNLIKEMTEVYEDAEESGLCICLPCKVGDTVWELCKCYDGIYRIFPMIVNKVLPYGCVRWIEGKEPTVWNIFATSDCTYMYKNFYDFGKTVFLTREEAEKALKEREKNG